MDGNQSSPDLLRIVRNLWAGWSSKEEKEPVWMQDQRKYRCQCLKRERRKTVKQMKPEICVE